MSETRLILSILLNLLITAAEVAGGLLSGSLALQSDALHNLSDAVALLITLIALRMGKRSRTAQRTFGYKRAGIMAALFNASVLLVVVVLLFIEAWKRLLQPHAVATSLMTAVAAVGLLANLATVLLLHRDAQGNLNIRSAYLHLLIDTASSVVVVAGGLAMHFFAIYWLDPVLTMFIGLLVVREAWSILRQTVHILMQSTPETIDLNDIQTAIEKIPGVGSLHHVHAWLLDDRTIHFEGHIGLCSDLAISAADSIRRDAETLLKERFRIAHVTLQIEYQACTPTDLVHNN